MLLGIVNGELFTKETRPFEEEAFAEINNKIAKYYAVKNLQDELIGYIDKYYNEIKKKQDYTSDNMVVTLSIVVSHYLNGLAKRKVKWTSTFKIGARKM